AKFFHEFSAINPGQVDGITATGNARVNESGYSSQIVTFHTGTGSTPSFQLGAKYGNHLYFRTSQNSDTNWDTTRYDDIEIWHTDNLNVTASYLESINQ